MGPFLSYLDLLLSGCQPPPPTPGLAPHPCQHPPTLTSSVPLSGRRRTSYCAGLFDVSETSISPAQQPTHAVCGGLTLSYHHSSALVVRTFCATSAHDICCPSTQRHWSYFLRSLSIDLTSSAACSQITDAARSAGPRWASGTTFSGSSKTPSPTPSHCEIKSSPPEASLEGPRPVAVRSLQERILPLENRKILLKADPTPVKSF